MFDFVSFIPRAIVQGIPLLFGSTGETLTEKSGNLNLGIAGISGCGQKELLEAIAGLQPTENGSICYVEDDGTREELLGKDPLSIAEMGVALSFVPEDRLEIGRAHV